MNLGLQDQGVFAFIQKTQSSHINCIFSVSQTSELDDSVRIDLWIALYQLKCASVAEMVQIRTKIEV